MKLLTVSRILSIFTLLVKMLERVQRSNENEVVNIESQMDDLLLRRNQAQLEISRARSAAEKLRQFIV